ncbi:MAG: carbon starvation CstA family protein [Bacteroidales bacterium]|nr:carbon starvation CstA family protein [Bacteroidales bacterium]
MYSFLLCLAALIVGYFVYGKLIERIFGPDDRPTPAVLHEDGVDFIRMPRWKIFMIQFLNIAGTGPIFGAIMGAKFGTSAFLWIVLGCIFGGAVHDYLSAMISLRHNGESLPELVGRYLGLTTKQVMRVFTIVLLILVGAVFVDSPAELLDQLTGGSMGVYTWMAIIFVYYLFASVMPIDKVIGKIYPIFAVALLFMAAGLLIAYFLKFPTDVPELWDGLSNTHPRAATTPIYPILFVTIACGAISGFHATQSPLMCRCMSSEWQGRSIFYGSMITEGIVALIWAAVATYFFHHNPDGINEPSAPKIVFAVTGDWLGSVGSVLAVLGVVAAPITTGDTALRSARLIVADILHIDQSSIFRRLGVSAAIFVVTFVVLCFSLSGSEGFNILWRYFAWANQTLSVFTLWAVTVYLVRHNKCFWITLFPALFMTTMCTTYLFIAPECLHLSPVIAHSIAAAVALISIVRFVCWYNGAAQKDRAL